MQKRLKKKGSTMGGEGGGKSINLKGGDAPSWKRGATVGVQGFHGVVEKAGGDKEEDGGNTATREMQEPWEKPCFLNEHEDDFH